jgi:hypothetical protein
MYNAEHKIAFEYDGAQHSVYTPHYHLNEHHFQYRRLLDRLKDEICREAGVTLIRIPWGQIAPSDPVRTARFLEKMLYTKGIPFHTILTDAKTFLWSGAAARWPGDPFPIQPRGWRSTAQGPPREGNRW